MGLPLILAGAALGGGLGSYGHDNWGWSKDAIWQGAAAGGIGGYAVGAAAPAAPLFDPWQTTPPRRQWRSITQPAATLILQKPTTSLSHLSLEISLCLKNRPRQ